MTKLRKGQKFKLTEDAIENYGEEYRDRIFKVSQWFDHHCPLDNPDPHGHPGYDSGAAGILYEAEDFSNAVYDWEIEPV